MSCICYDHFNPLLLSLQVLSLEKAAFDFKADKYSLTEEFELTANSLGAHMKVTESSPRMGHCELILRKFI